MAGYWLSCHAREIAAPSTAEVGSIGVVLMQREMSKALEGMDITYSVITAGHYKAAGNPVQPLSEEMRAYLQGGVDQAYELFLQNVEQGRRVSREKALSVADGRVFMAKEAPKAGLIDRICSKESFLQHIQNTLKETAMPVIVGTAPVHNLPKGKIAPVNEPRIIHSMSDFVAQFGQPGEGEAKADYTLYQAAEIYLTRYKVAPLVAINVFDPATHVANMDDETPSAPDVSKVTEEHIIGGTTGDARTGLALVEEVFPRFRIIPGQVLAPRFSADPTVALALGAACRNICGHFKATGIFDVPDSVTRYGDVAAWGDQTTAYPGITDVKDASIPIRRMFTWVGNTLVLSSWQFVSSPIRRRLVETVQDTFNVWLNGLAAREFILGGRVTFEIVDNPTSDLMGGKVRWHVYLCPPQAAREIVFMLEYDPQYLSTLFGTNS